MLAAGVRPRLPAAVQPPVFRAEARLVEIHATVSDGRGRYISGLKREDFVIRDSGQERMAEIFESTESPFSLGLLLDITGSMMEALPVVKRACLEMLDLLRPEDRVAVYAFNERFECVQDFTTDRRAAAAAIRKLQAAGRTALFDSLTRASMHLAQQKGKRSLVALTDGNDNASALTLESALRRARREAIPVYPVAQGDALRSSKLMDTLERIANATGGSSFRLEKPSKTDEIFARIGKDLLSSYLLAYRPHPGNGEWRPLQVSVRGKKDVRVRCREGYFAD